MSVEVGGNTGSCSRAGTLTFHGNTGDVSVNVTADRQGNFVARVTIPKGTFPTAYKLELTVPQAIRALWPRRGAAHSTESLSDLGSLRSAS